MARQINRLTALRVEKIKHPGYYADGAGLWLQVIKGGAKSWVFRYMLNGRQREMGLGGINSVTLADARIKATSARKLLVDKIDPIDARNAERAARLLELTRTRSFDECVREYIASHRAGWKNPKHADQWTNTLATYASPVLGSLPISAVDTGLVMRVLEPIWREKTETASRLRARIEAVLGWATVRGYRSGDNPARWRGHLDNLLPKRSKVAKVEHHPALPYKQIGAFIADLRGQEGTAARMLEFLILTATRTGEVISATWSEFDLQHKLWIIPAERMKAKREHRVPLSPRAIEILNALEHDKSGYVFVRHGKPLSNGAMLALLKRMARADLTAHGFRSTFRDWAAESTNYPREVAEMALAHTVGDKVEAAYRRGDLFDKRRRIMDEWAKYCEIVPASKTAVPIRRVNPQ